MEEESGQAGTAKGINSSVSARSSQHIVNKTFAIEYPEFPSDLAHCRGPVMWRQEHSRSTHLSGCFGSQAAADKRVPIRPLRPTSRRSAHSTRTTATSREHSFAKEKAAVRDLRAVSVRSLWHKRPEPLTFRHRKFLNRAGMPTLTEFVGPISTNVIRKADQSSLLVTVQRQDLQNVSTIRM